MCHILVPPKTDSVPTLLNGNTKSLTQNLSGPYLEYESKDFTCYIKGVQPGKNSTSFKFYRNGKLRLQSKDGTGEVIENDEGDGTKHVEWKFTTLFSRSDNGAILRCAVDWKAGQYEVTGLESKLTVHVNITCKCEAFILI